MGSNWPGTSVLNCYWVVLRFLDCHCGVLGSLPAIVGVPGQALCIQPSACGSQAWGSSYEAG